MSPLIVLFALAGLLLAMASAAPRLAFAWPEVFVPIVRGREGLRAFGVSFAALGAFLWWAGSA